MRAGGPHAQRVPGLLDRDAVGAGRHQELRDHARVVAAAGRDQVGVGVAGTGDERLGALDPEAVALARVATWSSRTAASRRRARSSRPRRTRRPPRARRISSRASKNSAGTPSALGHLLRDAGQRAGDRRVHVEHQRGRAVAAGQLVGDVGVVGEARAEAAERGPAPSARSGRPRADRRSRRPGTCRPGRGRSPARRTAVRSRCRRSHRCRSCMLPSSRLARTRRPGRALRVDRVGTIGHGAPASGETSAAICPYRAAADPEPSA